MISGHVDVVSAGVLAAELLVEACGTGDGLHLETVRGLGDDLRRGLSSFSADGTPDSLVEAALACADLATLAACNVPVLPDGGRPSAAAATHLAAGTTRALAALVEAGVEDQADAYSENVLRDLRSAVWKADLAVQQIGEVD